VGEREDERVVDGEPALVVGLPPALISREGHAYRRCPAVAADESNAPPPAVEQVAGREARPSVLASMT
jgi:hypothetical protein